MGGQGSTRWGGHVRYRTEREACAVTVREFCPEMREPLELSGHFRGGKLVDGMFTLSRWERDPDTRVIARTLILNYTQRPAWPDRIRVTSDAGRFGGLVWYLH